jgi:chemotaxis protein CheX
MGEVRIEFINPFIVSAVSSFKTMIFSACERVGVYVKKEDQTLMGGDVSVMMSIFGSLNGCVVLSFPRKVAIALVSSMLMDESIDDLDDDVKDGVCEIGNIVIGAAKSKIAATYGKEASVSIPTLFTGKPHEVQYPKGVSCIGCVFKTPHGKFSIEVAVVPDDDLVELL